MLNHGLVDTVIEIMSPGKKNLTSNTNSLTKSIRLHSIIFSNYLLCFQQTLDAGRIGIAAQALGIGQVSFLFFFANEG